MWHLAIYKISDPINRLHFDINVPIPTRHSIMFGISKQQYAHQRRKRYDQSNSGTEGEISNKLANLLRVTKLFVNGTYSNPHSVLNQFNPVHTLRPYPFN